MANGEEPAVDEGKEIGREKSRASAPEAWSKDDLWKKLDGLATCSTAEVGRDVWEAWQREPYGPTAEAASWASQSQRR